MLGGTLHGPHPAPLTPVRSACSRGACPWEHGSIGALEHWEQRDSAQRWDAWMCPMCVDGTLERHTHTHTHTVQGACLPASCKLLGPRKRTARDPGGTAAKYPKLAFCQVGGNRLFPSSPGLLTGRAGLTLCGADKLPKPGTQQRHVTVLGHGLWAVSRGRATE